MCFVSEILFTYSPLTTHPSTQHCSFSVFVFTYILNGWTSVLLNQCFEVLNEKVNTNSEKCIANKSFKMLDSQILPNPEFIWPAKITDDSSTIASVIRCMHNLAKRGLQQGLETVSLLDRESFPSIESFSILYDMDECLLLK